MTEEEWLASDRIPDDLPLSRRKATLFLTAAAKATPGAERRRRLLKAVEAAERAADSGDWNSLRGHHVIAAAACGKVKLGSIDHLWALVTRALTSEDVVNTWPRGSSHLTGIVTRDKALRAVHLNILRDILGNPFRPITFLPDWRTPTVLALAQQMYDSRDFSAMPILADALMDADCSDEVILMHCRGPGPHVRGCFCVDAILQRS
jgi:hypothetical protein